MKKLVKYLFIIFLSGIMLIVLFSYTPLRRLISKYEVHPSIKTASVEQQPESFVCTRNNMYSIPPEFIRAMSLIRQRLTEKQIPTDFIDSYYTCLNIQYAKLDEYKNGEFAGPESDPNNLVIRVNESLKASDDLLLSMLLFHEISHAEQYIVYLQKNDQTIMSCLDAESNAFVKEYLYFATLNYEERLSVTSRLRNLKSHFFYDYLKENIPLSNRTNEICTSKYNDKKEIDSCYAENMIKQVKFQLQKVNYCQP